MKFVRWSRAAQTDLASIDEYYRDLDPAHSLEIGQKAIAAGRFLATYPEAGRQVSDRDIRKWGVRGTPYQLFYRLDGDVLRILRLMHGARDWTNEL